MRKSHWFSTNIFYTWLSCSYYNRFYQLIKKSCLYTLLIIAADHMINHLTSYLSYHIEHILLSRSLVVTRWPAFYNSKSLYQMVQPTHLEGRKSHSLFCLLFWLCYSLCSYCLTVTMPFIWRKRPGIRRPIPPDPKLAS